MQPIPVLYSLNTDADGKTVQVVKLNAVSFTSLSKVHIHGSMTSDNFFNITLPRNSIQRVELMATCHHYWKIWGGTFP